jgi:hypothetical protein
MLVVAAELPIEGSPASRQTAGEGNAMSRKARLKIKRKLSQLIQLTETAYQNIQ